MRRTLPILVLVALMTHALTLHAGDVIDRIVVVVNGHVLLQSDWEDAISFESLVEGRAPNQASDQDRGAALNRLIDQELLREQAQSVESIEAPTEEVQKRVQEIRDKHPEAASNSAWEALLARYGLNEKKLASRLAEEITVAHQIDVRLRPTVQVDAESIEAYYRNTFLPELHRVGGEDVPLTQVSARIRELLTEQRVNAAFTSWLQTLRNESKIRSWVPLSHPAASPGGQGQ